MTLISTQLLDLNRAETQAYGREDLEIISPTDNSVVIRAAAHPFKAAHTQVAVPAGLSIAEIIELVQPDPILRRYGHVFIGDDYIPRDRWPRVRPRPGTHLTIRLVPAGGDDKNPLALILGIVVLAVSTFLSAGTGVFLGHPLLGTSLTVGKLLGGVVGLVGSLIINAIAPPPRPKLETPGKESPTFSIEGGRNQANPFGPVPRVLGRHRMVPPLGALPFTEIVGNDQYLNMLFVWGPTPVAISDLRIGDTPLGDFQNVEVQTYDGWTAGQLEQLSLFSNDVYQENLSIKLANAAEWQKRTTQPDTDKISIDVTFPQGLVGFDDNGNKVRRSVSITFGYRHVDEGAVVHQELPENEAADAAAWDVGGFRARDVGGPGGGNWSSYFDELQNQPLQSSTQTFSGKQTNVLRRSITWTVPRGQYELWVRRVTGDAPANGKIIDEVYWTAMRSITAQDPIRRTGLAKTAIRIRASDQLNGIVDQFNGIVESIVPDWDTTSSTWITRATSNPASLFRTVLQDSANARPLADNRIDLAGLQSWHEFCDDAWEQFDGANADLKYRYNSIIDYSASVREVLHDVASAGRASPTNKDGKWGVVIDREQTVPVQHFTPRNSWDFEGRKAFDDLPHGFRVRFLNGEKDWRQDERVVYDYGKDVTSATKFEGLELPGITDPKLVWIHGRYHIASARLRPETYSFSADIEHIVCTRGDLIRVTHDVPLWGIASGRIASIATDGGAPELALSVTLDEECAMEEGKTYSVRFRQSDGSARVERVNTVAGFTKTLTFSEPFEVADTIGAGDLAMFGEMDQESVELIVKSIEPGPDLSARLVCVDAAPLLKTPELYTESSEDSNVAEAIPEFDSQITLPGALPQPVIESIRSDESVLEVTPDGGLNVRVLVAIRPLAAIEANLEVHLRPADTDGNFVRVGNYPNTPSEVYITGVEDGETYDFRFRWIPARVGLTANKPSDWYEVRHTVVGKSTAPSDLTGLTLEGVGGRAILRWSARPELDVRFGGKISFRHSPALSGVVWSATTFIGEAQGAAVDADLPLMPGTYLARPFDSSGRPSESATTVTTKQVSILAFTGVATASEDPDFAGMHDNTGVADDVLHLVGEGQIDDEADFDAIADLDFIGGVSSSGTYYFANSFDFGSVRRVRLTRHLDVHAILVLDRVDTRMGLVDDWQDFDGNGAAAGDASIWLRHTDDDPAASPTWSRWQRLFASEIEARGVEFRIDLSTEDTSYNMRVSEASVTAEELAA